MNTLTKYYRFVNILSVDVAVGAICCGLFFAKILHVTLWSYGIISLGLTVWIIYTADHLLDAYKLKSEASTLRHKFHQKNFSKIVLIMCLAILADAVVITFMRKQLVICGIFLALGVALYLLLQHYMKVLKEFAIAILYTLGVLLPSASIVFFSMHSIQSLPVVLIIQFAFTALINLLLFSWYDREYDMDDGNASFATIMGDRATRVFIALLLLSVFTLSFFSEQALASLFILAMNLVLGSLLLYKNELRKHDYYRMIGDAIFFIPALYLLF